MSDLQMQADLDQADHTISVLTAENERLKAANADLLIFAENVLRFAESVGDEYGAEQARAVMAKSRGA